MSLLSCLALGISVAFGALDVMCTGATSVSPVITWTEMSGPRHVLTIDDDEYAEDL